jgi:hypothetical protein
MELTSAPMHRLPKGPFGRSAPYPSACHIVVSIARWRYFSALALGGGVHAPASRSPSGPNERAVRHWPVAARAPTIVVRGTR